VLALTGEQPQSSHNQGTF